MRRIEDTKKEIEEITRKITELVPPNVRQQQIRVELEKLDTDIRHKEAEATKIMQELKQMRGRQAELQEEEREAEHEHMSHERKHIAEVLPPGSVLVPGAVELVDR